MIAVDSLSMRLHVVNIVRVILLIVKLMNLVIVNCIGNLPFCHLLYDKRFLLVITMGLVLISAAKSTKILPMNH